MRCTTRPVLDAEAPDVTDHRGRPTDIQLGNSVVFLQADPGLVTQNGDRLWLNILSLYLPDIDILQVRPCVFGVLRENAHTLQTQALGMAIDESTEVNSGCCEAGHIDCGLIKTADVDHADRALGIVVVRISFVDRFRLIRSQHLGAILIEDHIVWQRTNWDITKLAELCFGAFATETEEADFAGGGGVARGLIFGAVGATASNGNRYKVAMNGNRLSITIKGDLLKEGRCFEVAQVHQLESVTTGDDCSNLVLSGICGELRTAKVNP